MFHKEICCPAICSQLWSGFDSRTCPMWVESVVGSRPHSVGFYSGSPIFLPLQKPAFQIPFMIKQEVVIYHILDQSLRYILFPQRYVKLYAWL